MLSGSSFQSMRRRPLTATGPRPVTVVGTVVPMPAEMAVLPVAACVTGPAPAVWTAVVAYHQ